MANSFKQMIKSGMLTESRHATKAAVERADALAVENAAMREALDSIRIFSSDTLSGPSDSVPDMAAWLREGVEYLYHISNVETPATDAALAAIRTKEHADFIAVFNEHIKTAGLDDDELVTVRECRDALKHATELREAK